jgi:hypothetical protein
VCFGVGQCLFYVASAGWAAGCVGCWSCRRGTLAVSREGPAELREGLGARPAGPGPTGCMGRGMTVAGLVLPVRSGRVRSYSTGGAQWAGRGGGQRAECSRTAIVAQIVCCGDVDADLSRVGAAGCGDIAGEAVSGFEHLRHSVG